MTRNDRILKWLLYALGVLPVWLLETTVLNRLPLFGIIPVLLPLTAVAVGFWEGASAGAVYGLCVGVIADAVYPGLPGGMTLGVAILGWLTGMAVGDRMRRNLLGYFICSAVSLAALELFRVLGALLAHLSGPGPLFRLAALEGAWSLCFSLPIYGLYKLIYRRVGGERLGGAHG